MNSDESCALGVHCYYGNAGHLQYLVQWAAPPHSVVSRGTRADGMQVEGSPSCEAAQKLPWTVSRAKWVSHRSQHSHTCPWSYHCCTVCWPEYPHPPLLPAIDCKINCSANDSKDILIGSTGQLWPCIGTSYDHQPPSDKKNLTVIRTIIVY